MSITSCYPQNLFPNLEDFMIAVCAYKVPKFVFCAMCPTGSMNMLLQKLPYEDLKVCHKLCKLNVCEIDPRKLFSRYRHGPRYSWTFFCLIYLYILTKNTWSKNIISPTYDGMYLPRITRETCTFYDVVSYIPFIYPQS